MVQETTFNSAYQADGSENILSPHVWLDAVYSEASHKKIDQTHFCHLLKTFLSFTFLEKELNYSFSDRNFLAQSFYQTTFCHENRALQLTSNERLEFLGDSLLNMMVAEVLYVKYPEKNEGDLSKLRGSLVNESELAKIALSLNLENNLFLGKGEFKSNGHLKDSILADAFESLLAAIYIDSNRDTELLKEIFNNIIKRYESKTKKDFYSDKVIDEFDSKSTLQELCVAKTGHFPVYKAREHDGGFTVEIWVGETMIADMFGLSKKKTEKELAKRILEQKIY